MVFKKGHNINSGSYNLRQKKGTVNEAKSLKQQAAASAQQSSKINQQQNNKSEEIDDVHSDDDGQTSSADVRLFESHFPKDKRQPLFHIDGGDESGDEYHSFKASDSAHGDGVSDDDINGNVQQAHSYHRQPSEYGDEAEEEQPQLSTADQQHEQRYQRERAATLMATDASLHATSSFSRSSSFGLEEVLSNITQTSSSSSSGCKRNCGEAGITSYTHANSGRRGDDGYDGSHYYSSKRGGGGGTTTMQSLSASMTEDCQMSPITKKTTAAAAATPGFHLPRRAAVPPEDLFEPGKLSMAATTVQQQHTAIVAKPSVPVGSNKRIATAGAPSPPIIAAAPVTTTRLMSGSSLGRKGAIVAKGGKGHGASNGGAADGSSGGVSRLQSTMQNIKHKKMMPKPSGSTTEVRLTTIWDDVEEVGFAIANAYGARNEIKELKTYPKRLIYKEHQERVFSKYVPDINERNASYLKTANGQPSWLFSNLPVTTDENERDAGDMERYFETKEHWREFFRSGRRDPDNGNRPFTLEEATHRLAADEMEAYVFLSASIHSKDDYMPAV